MKKTIILLWLISVFFVTAVPAAAENFTLGIGPVGNFPVVDGRPEFSPGVGGQLFLDYRWNPQLSTQVGVLVTTQDGEGPDKGDKSIEFLGIPTFDVKYYLTYSNSHWDPFLLAGIGIYAVTQGSKKNGTPAIGLGANAGIGVDYYFNQKFSAGLSAIYRSIALIDDTTGSNNGTALFPFSFSGFVGFHF